MQPSRALTENRNLTNLRTTPDSKATPTCCNHPDKPATHSLLHPHAHLPLPYCEKCSIMLASKGHNILKLQPALARPTPYKAARSPILSPRAHDIRLFLEELAWHIDELGQRHSESEEVLRSS